MGEIVSMDVDSTSRFEDIAGLLTVTSKFAGASAKLLEAIHEARKRRANGSDAVPTIADQPAAHTIADVNNEIGAIGSKSRPAESEGDVVKGQPDQDGTKRVDVDPTDVVEKGSESRLVIAARVLGSISTIAAAGSDVAEALGAGSELRTEFMRRGDARKLAKADRAYQLAKRRATEITTGGINAISDVVEEHATK